MSDDEVDEPRSGVNDIIVSFTNENSVEHETVSYHYEPNEYEAIVEKLANVSWKLKEFCRVNNVPIFNDPNTVNIIINSYPFS
jgi:hypothetical protein